MESLFWGTSRASQQGLHILSMLLDCQSAQSVASPATNVGIFLYKSVRFGLITVVQSAFILYLSEPGSGQSLARSELTNQSYSPHQHLPG